MLSFKVRTITKVKQKYPTGENSKIVCFVGSASMPFRCESDDFSHKTSVVFFHRAKNSDTSIINVTMIHNKIIPSNLRLWECGLSIWICGTHHARVLTVAGQNDRGLLCNASIPNPLKSSQKTGLISWCLTSYWSHIWEKASCIHTIILTIILNRSHVIY